MPNSATYVEALVDGDTILCTCLRHDGTHTPVGSLKDGHTSVQCKNCKAQVCLDVKIHQVRLYQELIHEHREGQKVLASLIAAVAAL